MKINTFNISLLIIAVYAIIRLIFLQLVSVGSIEYQAEIPISSIQNVQFTNDRVYVGIGYYNRIQVYNNQGKYLKMIETENYMKDFWFQIVDEKDNYIIDKPISRDIDTSNYVQPDATITIKHNFPYEIRIETNKGKEILIKNSIFQSLYFNSIIHFVLLISVLLIIRLYNYKEL